MLRRNVANFNSEVEADGRFSALKGIVNSLNSLKIDKFKSTSLINVGADGSRDPSWLYHSGYSPMRSATNAAHSAMAGAKLG